jgi:V/A-type H+-transporting ATPase subunit A
MTLLQKEVELLEIVQLVGPDALAETERAELAVARLLREGFLQQSAYHPSDRFCSLNKTYWMLKAIMDFYSHTKPALEARITLEQIMDLAVFDELGRLKETEAEDIEEKATEIMDQVQTSFSDMGVT